MNHRDAWTTWSGRGTRPLTGGLLAALVALAAGVLGCGAEAEQGRDPGPDPAPDPSTAPADDPCLPGAGPDPERERLPRMCAVADAWEASDAAGRWAAEFHPLAPLVELPEGGLRDESDTRAFENGSFKALTSLPDESADGSIRWENGENGEAGENGPVPLRSAADVFGEMDSGIDDHSPDFHALRVTDVEPGEMRLRTSRGPAEVPAWLFTLDGYDTPLRHAAVAVPEPPAAPVGPVAADGEHRPVGLEALGPVSEDGRQVTVTLLMGSCDDLAVDVLETDESVVLAASVVGGPPPGTRCTEEERTVRKTVDLERPLAERAPLDAHTGEALQPERAPAPG
ncbi:hypothetical protein [Streptomyces sp. MP131-18]|uniref:hypothetical protein n=1 Tax=Streptomyces sp. MP131-18 TaxID=1857892 RepID=UPI0009A2493F|nr:hypothetical protein [Streptomyces sp. MP131-18]ONK13561.1 hypothetical protein STBA_43310 [Streptomyces sp. MP131-18]